MCLPKNATFMMMGSADELPSAPPEPIKFLEDMSESEAAAVSECVCVCVCVCVTKRERERVLFLRQTSFFVCLF